MFHSCEFASGICTRFGTQNYHSALKTSGTKIALITTDASIGVYYFIGIDWDADRLVSCVYQLNADN